MSDIFVSYSTKDRERVRPLADALEKAGWSVWWDRRIPIGKSFDAEIQEELDKARAVVVLWTSHSVASRWVRSEAERAAKQEKALPILMEGGIELPLGVSLLQTADLSDWHGEAEHEAFRCLVDQLARQLSGASRPEERLAPTQTNSIHPHTLFVRLILSFLALVLVIGMAALSLLRIPQATIELDIETRDFHFVSATRQDLFGLLTIPELQLAGVRRLYLPRARAAPARVFSNKQLQGIFVYLRDLDWPSDDAAITLESVPLNVGSAVRFIVSPEESAINVSLDGGPFEFQVNLQNALEITLPPEGPTELDIGPPKSMRIVTLADEVALSFTPSDAKSPISPTPLSISSLGLFRIDERGTGQVNRLQRTPTILSGRLKIEESSVAGQVLEMASDLHLAISAGEIEIVELLSDRFRIRFKGVVSELKQCKQDVCDSLMPSYLEYFGYLSRFRH